MGIQTIVYIFKNRKQLVTIDIKRQEIDGLYFVMCLLLVLGFQGFFFLFFDAVVNSTNEANKAGGMRH